MRFALDTFGPGLRARRAIGRGVAVRVCGLLAALTLAGCSGALVGGAAVASPTEYGAIVASASEAEGLRVLMNAHAENGSGDEGVWMATSSAELAALWRMVERTTPPPEVDFATHIVLGAGFWDGVCQPTLSEVLVDDRDVVSLLREPHPGVCTELGAYVGRVIAVPRAILPESFVWLPRSLGSEPVGRFTLAR